MPLKQSKTTPRMTSATAAALARSKEVIDNGGTQAEAVAAAKEAVRNALREQREQHQEREQQPEWEPEQQKQCHHSTSSKSYARGGVRKALKLKRAVISRIPSSNRVAAPMINESRDENNIDGNGDDDHDEDNTPTMPATSREPNLRNPQEERREESWLQFLTGGGPCSQDSSLCGGDDSVCNSMGERICKGSGKPSDVPRRGSGNNNSNSRRGRNDIVSADVDGKHYHIRKKELIMANANANAMGENKKSRGVRRSRSSRRKSIAWTKNTDHP